MTSQVELSQPVESELPAMFRPPVNRAMRVLDRSFFRKTVPLTAATVFENTNIAPIRSELLKSRDLLAVPRQSPIRSPQEKTVQAWKKPGEAVEKSDLLKKCLLLREDIKYDGGCHTVFAHSFGFCEPKKLTDWLG